MRRRWPFLLYALVAVLHLLQILTGLPGREVTKPLLMGSLGIAVALTAFLTDRRRVLAAPRRTPAIALLLVGIALSLTGDELLGPSFVAGLGCFALAQLLYVTDFSTAVRHRRTIPWWALVYVVGIIGLAMALWPYLGDLQITVVLYGAILALNGMAGARVNRITTLGTALFVVSDSLLALRLFLPDFGAYFADPWQDFTIMLAYCLGQGLIAYGIVTALAKAGERDEVA